MGVLLRMRLAYFVSFVLGLCLSLGPVLVLVWLFSKWNSLVSAQYGKSTMVSGDCRVSEEWAKGPSLRFLYSQAIFTTVLLGRARVIARRSSASGV